MEGGRNFRRWGLVGRSISLGHDLESYIETLTPLFLSLFDS
jgi:hypothetical protein